VAKDVLLEVNDLKTSFTTEQGEAHAVRGVSFNVRRGRTLGIVGESGCGKTVTSFSIMRLLPKPAGKITGGSIRFEGKDLVTLPAEKMHEIRGNHISMIFQEPMSALNPVHKIGKQLKETYRLHQTDMNEEELERAAIDLLEKVGIPAPARRLREYPHQLSGGMRQRIVIAIALACKPDILIADEPTTALDVTIQAQILDLMKKLQEDTGMAIIFITHDLGVIAEVCDDVLVMYGGKKVEQASVFELFANPRHPYTKGLLESIPKLDSPHKQKLTTIEGIVPSLFNMPKGCPFANRCPVVTDKCHTAMPEIESVGADHTLACFNWKKG